LSQSQRRTDEPLARHLPDGINEQRFLRIGRDLSFLTVDRISPFVGLQAAAR
jgi:hypothetical protein